MNDSLKFRGEVIARNKKTGEILFHQHNCIVEGGRLMTLAKAMGLNNNELVALSQGITENDDLKAWFENASGNAGDYYIKYFKAGLDTSEGTVGNLGVNTKASNLSNLNNPWFVGDIAFFSKEDVQKDDIPDEYYKDDTSYDWPTGDNLIQPIINRASDYDTLFLRYKLNLKMPTTSIDDDDFHNNGWHNVDLTYPYVLINELGLFITSDEDDEDHEWLLFSLLKFPTITLQAEMEVEFEYRIYG